MNDVKVKEMREMIDRLNHASDAYYNGLPEEMTDFEWDALFDKVKALEEETGFSFPDSPTQKVSSDDTQGQKEPHEFAALSLRKPRSRKISSNGRKDVRSGSPGSSTV